MRIHTLKSDDPARLELIVQLLNAGHRATDIAPIIGVHRERIRQLIRGEIDLSRLRIPCHLCGKVMGTQWGLRHRYHPACAALANQETRREGNAKKKTKHWHQRSKPDGEFEQTALAVYAKRGYDVLWMPHLAPFDFVVNGLSVDVKGARSAIGQPWQFGMSQWRGHGTEIEMAKRCTIAHFVGKFNGSYQHFIVPAELIGVRKSVSFYPVPQLFRCDQCGAQSPSAAGLHVHKARWCGRTPNWQEYKDNWWRFGHD